MQQISLAPNPADEARLEGATVATHGLAELLNDKVVPALLVLTLLQKTTPLSTGRQALLDDAIENLQASLDSASRALEMLLQVPKFWEWCQEEFGPFLDATKGANTLLEQLYRDNMSLSERVGWLQARVQEVERENHLLKGSLDGKSLLP